MAASTYWKRCGHLLGSVPEQPINNSFQKFVSTASPTLHSSPGNNPATGINSVIVRGCDGREGTKAACPAACRQTINTASESLFRKAKGRAADLRAQHAPCGGDHWAPCYCLGGAALSPEDRCMGPVLTANDSRAQAGAQNPELMHEGMAGEQQHSCGKCSGQRRP